MRNNISIYIYLVIMAVLVSCSKLTVPQDTIDDCVSFYVSDKNFADQDTKAIVENTDKLFELKLDLLVCDLVSINGAETGENLIKDKVFNYDSDYKLWRNKDVKWNTNKSYEFYGYMLSPGKGTGASVSQVTTYKGNPGHCVDVCQPSTYTHNNDDVWSDYLLSYRVNAQGKNKPLVRLEMERVTSGVELYISTPKGAQSVVESISFKGVKRCMRYTIAEHAIANATLFGIRNKWVYQDISGAENSVVDYSRSETSAAKWFEVQTKADEDSRFDSKFRMMRFLTVPQDVTGTLEVVYRVNETDNKDNPRANWTQYTALYNLSETAITRWELGRKTRYYISLDTAIDLEGVIADWVDIDYVEGTFLPR